MKYLFPVMLLITVSFSSVRAGNPPSHDVFDKELKQYVDDQGDVNYASWKKNTADLEAYLDVLAECTPESSWSREESLVYWINAYNAFTIKLILDNYPVNSIMDIYNGKPWDEKWISLGGKTYSLNQIENEIIRPQFKEPRIHFAVNCAAASCPPLRNSAYTADTLEEQLAQQTTSFINNKDYNQMRTTSAKVSKIFEWYADDFGDLSVFLGRYSPFSGGKISYNEYDWSLNKQ